MTEDIKVTFIIPRNCRSENECSEEMQLAFTACEQHSGGGLKAQFVHESNYTKFDGLTKKDVFVLNEFDGELYEKLKTTKCLLVGPRCLSCCLTEGVPIPSGPEPVFTVAMRGLVVTASGLSKQQKETIKKKVHWMGGIYSVVLTDETTHLVSNTVLSDKYIKSVEKGIPVMAESWIHAVWEASLSLNVRGSSSDFDDHKLPPFANLQVTTSGITKKDKQMIMKLVNEYGGTFSGAFQSETTDIVILTKEGIGSEKYKAAIEYGKACVVPAWVKESAASGAALPLSRYRVAGASTSSPLAEHRLPDMSLNFSRITNLRPPSNFVDETRAADMSTLSGKMKLSQDSKKSNDSSVIDKELQTAFENFDMSLIKKAGPIFDGFCIWVTGLEGVSRERAAAMVSKCGGVRYDCPHERVTHAVAGTKGAAASVGLACPNVPILSPMWLLKSVIEGRALDEAEFLIDAKPATPVKSTRKPRIEPASPMSKRNIQLLRRGPLDLPPPTPERPERNDEIVNHYLSQVVEPEPASEKTPEKPEPNVTLPLPQDITDDVEEPTEEVEQIFAGMKLEVQGLDEEAICEIGAEVAAAGGVLLAGGAPGARRLVPLDFDPDPAGGAEAVTVFWIKDCLSQQELLPIQYYHRPVKLPQWSPGAPLPLEGVVASLSTYSGVERAFLDELAKLLGATTQLRFCRRNTATAQASTHLICPTPSGDKYQGALKWGLPAVTADWLMQCAKEGRRVSERNYLVGDTKAPPSPEKPSEEPMVEQAHEQTNVTTDKENAMLPPEGAVLPRRSSAPSREQTPKHKATAVDDMSPASRYIAMARQGLLGGDSQETPKRIQDLKDDARQDVECGVRTPPLDDALSTPNLRGLSPTTRRRLQAVRRGEMPSDPIRTPADPFDKNPETPDSAFGAALRPGSGRLSPEARKRLWKVVQDLPSKETHPIKEKHTPLSEIRNRFLAQFNGDAPTPPSDHTLAPRKLHLQDQADTPPAKIAKISIDQSAGGGIISDIDETSKSASNSTKSSSSSALPLVVDAQLQRLSAALSSRLSSQRARRTRDSLTLAPPSNAEAGPESQPNTVGWDDTTPAQNAQCEPVAETAPAPAVKRFMLSSNVDNREEIIEMIQYLGGEVCEGAELDPAATHLLCAAPGRSEKMLGSVAAGRWVLHPAYIPRSRACGKFVSEEEYEWGNPLAASLPSLSGAESQLARAAHRWRSARAHGRPGPLAGVAALLHVPPARRRLLARLVLAGGGAAPDLQPPYNDESITVCFADLKRYPISERDAAWLMSRKIPVCPPVLLSSYLTDETPPVPEEHCLPEFKPK
ncbi:DNA topoisomerase 2-binding protein 1-A [Amyelois transitella]|uniref:DNA topoisomerase 2-binding protein 1-A n=1 Tax=Amyelois transitella TaxID=680683 RepID=UPI00298F558F|nr:DNA topoisomerase 2-binding protein 1-A [Amyelois transitella]